MSRRAIQHHNSSPSNQSTSRSARTIGPDDRPEHSIFFARLPCIPIWCQGSTNLDRVYGRFSFVHSHVNKTSSPVLLGLLQKNQGGLSIHLLVHFLRGLFLCLLLNVTLRDQIFTRSFSASALERKLVATRRAKATQRQAYAFGSWETPLLCTSLVRLCWLPSTSRILRDSWRLAASEASRAPIVDP